MRRGFYLRLAVDGIWKNRKLYLPYLLAATGMITMFYIIVYLAESPVLPAMRGGDTMAVVMGFGRYVMAVFAVIFLFYTNSFLIRRRNKEFGLYNILGMSKGNISRILFWETVISCGVTLVAGLFFGILLSKLSELALVNLTLGEVSYDYSVSCQGIWETVGLFAAIFVLLLFVSLGRVRLSDPMTLLKSENLGEKPPKANWVLAVLGILLLAGAYYLALSIQEPIAAIAWFFIAVVMVILATYLLFVAGSVTLCRILQKSRSYYYQVNHFVSTASMAYRMKRNGAGLATICILSTMVLVTVSSTTSLFFGAKDEVQRIYPYDISVVLRASSPEALASERTATLREMIREASGTAEEDFFEYNILSTAGLLRDDGEVILDHSAYTGTYSMDDLCELFLFSLEEYNRVTGNTRTLQSGTALLCTGNSGFPGDTLTMEGRSWTLIEVDDVPEKMFHNGVSITRSYALVVDDFDELAAQLMSRKTDRGLSLGDLCRYYSFDRADLSGDDQIRLAEEIDDTIHGILGDEGSDIHYNVESQERNLEEFYSLYGSLFFLGIVLSLVFMLAAALIIYYKQISEGYEDQSRFEIMQKVGMTAGEIRKSINSQVLTVFLAPLILAGVHMTFAFSMVYKILQCMGMSNKPLFLLVNLGCFTLFGILYGFVYRGTSNAYYKIVRSE